MAFCPNCGTQLTAGANNCAACGKPVGQSAGGGAAAAPAQAPAASGLQDNIAGLLAYVTIIPAIVFLVVEPYNRNRFIRFHSFQSIFLHLLWVPLAVLLGIVGMIPFLGLISLALWPLAGLAFFAAWIICLIKAYGNQQYKLPIIGDFAEKQANA